jgi:murein DD-endopeptidase MepM/ murein hydrolase activator NlpD
VRFIPHVRSVPRRAVLAAVVLVSSTVVAPRSGAVPNPGAAVDPNATTTTPTIPPETTTTVAVPVTPPVTTLPITVPIVSTAPPLASTLPPVPVDLSTTLPIPVDVSTIPTTVDPSLTTTIDPNVTTTLDPNVTTIPLVTTTLAPYEVFDEFLIPEIPPGADLNTFAEFDDAGSSQDIEGQQAGLGITVYGSPTPGTNLQAELNKLTSAQRQVVLDAQARLAASVERVNAAKLKLEELNNEGRGSRDEIARLEEQRERIAEAMQDRAIRQYTGESARFLRILLEAKDMGSYRRRADLISQAQRRDAAVVEQYRLSAKQIKRENARYDAILDARSFEVQQLENEQQQLEIEFARVKGVLQALEAPVAFEGFVFPVQPPYAYSDTYGADRMNGTQYQHQHQGVDIFASEGQPVIATKRGVVYSVGVARLGGNRLWLKDGDGNCYYYAHLQAFAATVYERKVVEAGEVLGFVGTTGNARGTPPHLHYEIHPNCQGPTNPTPILKAVEKADLEAWVKEARPIFGASVGASVTSLPVAGQAAPPGASIPTTIGRPLVGNAPGGSTAVLPTRPVPGNSGTTRPAPKGVNPTIPAPVFTPAPAQASTTAGSGPSAGNTSTVP